jgi:hypothetical protein
MTDERLAALFAGQTAIVASICELLIERKVIERTELCNRLHELLRKCRDERADPSSGAPIMHLLHILELEASDSSSE